jgi:hypothetical protein
LLSASGVKPAATLSLESVVLDSPRLFVYGYGLGILALALSDKQLGYLGLQCGKIIFGNGHLLLLDGFCL